MLTCGYDYMTEGWNHQSYIAYAFVFDYCIPMTLVLYFYSQIVKKVWAHEASLRAQAKKMNVDSLRANQDSSKESIEFRIAKVCFSCPKLDNFVLKMAKTEILKCPKFHEFLDEKFISKIALLFSFFWYKIVLKTFIMNYTFSGRHYQCVPLGLILDSLCCHSNDCLLWKPIRDHSSCHSNSSIHSEICLLFQSPRFCRQSSFAQEGFEQENAVFGNL